MKTVNLDIVVEGNARTADDGKSVRRMCMRSGFCRRGGVGRECSLLADNDFN